MPSLNRAYSNSIEAIFLKKTFDQREGGDLKLKMSILPPKGVDFLFLGSLKIQKEVGI